MEIRKSDTEINGNLKVLCRDKWKFKSFIEINGNSKVLF